MRKLAREKLLPDLVVKIVGLVCLVVLTPGCGGPTKYDRAMAAVQANMATLEGKAYDEAFGKALNSTLPQLVDSCQSNYYGAHPPSFSILLKLDAAGAPRDSTIWPDFPLSRCIRDGLIVEKYPKPPSAGYWAQIESQGVAQ